MKIRNSKFEIRNKFQIPISKLVIGLLVIISSLVIGYWSLAFALVDPAEIGVGARPLGMGSAFTAVADDGSSIFINPAGLAQNTAFNLTSMSGALLQDVTYTAVGIANESPVGKVGFGYINISTTGIPITTLTGTGSTAVVTQIGSTNYNSGVIILSYGLKLSRLLGKLDFVRNVKVGFNIKYFLQEIPQTNNFAGARGIGSDLDFGLQAPVSPWADLGITLQNALSESLGGKFIWEGGGSITEGIPLRTKIGLGLTMLGPQGLWKDTTQKVITALDYTPPGQSGRPATWQMGVEYQPLPPLVLRVGLDQKPRAAENGIGVDNNLSLGIGIKYRGFSFDYAYHQFGEMAENATHFFSLGYRGEEKVEILGAGPAEGREGIPYARVVPKPKLKKFTDVPDAFWAREVIEYLATLGLMDGYPDDTFRPRQEVTRLDFAVLLVKAKGFELPKKARNLFHDIPVNHWAAPYVEVAVQRGYMNGYSNATFRPDQKVSRAEAMATFARFAGLYVKEQVKKQFFSDLPTDHWASPAVAATREAGFLEYLSGKKFEPDKILTRAEAAEMLSKTSFAKEKIKQFIFQES